MKRTVNAKKVIDDAELYIMESIACIPFPIKRVYCIRKCKKFLVRGMHAHKKTQQVLFCIQGSMDLVLDNGKNKVTFHLDNPRKGVIINARIWHVMKKISVDAVLLILASLPYKEIDYIRNYQEFRTYIKKFNA
jgi:dTDP-4-dehydrorhamnose 3,5-epimerase-like enzyme